MTSCRLNSKFAFCVMRNPEEAAKALNLNGIPYLGNVLKLVSSFVLTAAFVFLGMGGGKLWVGLFWSWVSSFR